MGVMWKQDTGCASERIYSTEGEQLGRRHTDTQLKVGRGPCRESVGAKLVQGKGLTSASELHQDGCGSRTELVGRHKSSWGAAEVPRFWLRGTRALVGVGCGGRGMAGKAAVTGAWSPG